MYVLIYFRPLPPVVGNHSSKRKVFSKAVFFSWMMHLKKKSLICFWEYLLCWLWALNFIFKLISIHRRTNLSSGVGSGKSPWDVWSFDCVHCEWWYIWSKVQQAFLPALSTPPTRQSIPTPATVKKKCPLDKYSFFCDTHLLKTSRNCFSNSFAYSKKPYLVDFF